MTVTRSFHLSRALLGLGATAAVLASGAAAVAAPPPAGVGAGPELGVRLGYAIPFGSAENGINVDRNVSGAVPVVVEAGVRLGGAFFAGGLIQYGFAQVKDPSGLCSGQGNSCSGSVVRVGVEGIYRFLPDLALAPWVGLGLGYEWLNTSASSNAFGGIRASHTYRGIELLTLQAGGEYRAGRSWLLGPFASYSLGRFGTSTGSAQLGGTVGTTTGDIADTAIHSWVMLELRGAFAP